MTLEEAEEVKEVLRCRTNLGYGIIIENESTRVIEEALDLAIKALEQQPSDDCVSRDSVKELFQEGSVMGLYYFLGIDDLPSVIPKGVTVTDFADKCRECGKQKKGKWIFTKTKFDRQGCTAECFSCHKKWKTYDEIRFEKENKFCPNCGADMRGRKDN